jgi:hypothetical protein
MKKQRRGLRLNLNFARAIWGQLPKTAQHELRELTAKYALSVPLGDVKYMEDRWYVTHAGLLRLALRRHCSGIKVQQVREFCDPTMGRRVFKATLYKNRGSQGFVGYGDADPSNTSPLVRGAEMRVAETRAVNRALRKAYGIGLCSVEELGWLSGSAKPSQECPAPVKPPHPNGSNNGQPKLRDRLCILIRRYNLDPTLVKAYAADYCGTSTLREANRELVESFITHLAASAQENKEALICKLNSYALPMEVKS